MTTLAPEEPLAKPYFAWGRVTLVVSLFAVALAAGLWNWRSHPPIPRSEATSINGRNATGDLETVLVMLTIEFLIAFLAVQPWSRWPRRRWFGIAGLGFVVWGVLLFISSMHAPPVMLANTLLMPVLGLLMVCLTLAYQRRGEDPEYIAAMHQ